MIELLLSILPLAIASAASPGIIIVTLALLSKKEFGALTSFFIGCLIAAIILAAIGISFAAEDDVVAESMGFSALAIDLALGILLLAFGIKVILEKPKNENRIDAKKKSRGAFAWLAIGIIGSLTNFDAVLLNLAAVREIFNSTAAMLNKFLMLAFCDLFLLSPILLPCALYIFAPQKSQKILAPVAVWLKKWGNLLVGAIFIMFGIFLVLKAF